MSSRSSLMLLSVNGTARSLQSVHVFVADRDSNRLSLHGEPGLPTTARGVSSAQEGNRRQGSAHGVNSFQCPSETTSTVPSLTVMAVWSSMAYAGPGMPAAHLSAAA